jgi:hypothetical protein
MIKNVSMLQFADLCALTFGGMWRWRRVAVARVFALVVRCWVMMVITYFSRWQKP